MSPGGRSKQRRRGGHREPGGTARARQGQVSRPQDSGLSLVGAELFRPEVAQPNQVETSLINCEGGPGIHKQNQRPRDHQSRERLEDSTPWAPPGHLRQLDLNSPARDLPAGGCPGQFPTSRQASLHARQPDPGWRHHGVPSLLRPVASLRKSCPLGQPSRYARNPALLKVLSSRLLSPAHFLYQSLDFLHRNQEETWGRA